MKNKLTNIALIAFGIVMAIVMIAAPKQVEASYYAPAVVVESVGDTIVVDVDMPDGSIHEFAFEGNSDAFKKGEQLRLEMDSNCTNEYSDDAVMHVYK